MSLFFRLHSLFVNYAQTAVPQLTSLADRNLCVWRQHFCRLNAVSIFCLPVTCDKGNTEIPTMAAYLGIVTCHSEIFCLYSENYMSKKINFYLTCPHYTRLLSNLRHFRFMFGKRKHMFTRISGI